MNHSFGITASVSPILALRKMANISARDPRIDDHGSGLCKVFYVPRHNDEFMFNCGCDNQAIGCGDRNSFSLGLNGKPSPTIDNCLGDRQEVGFEPFWQTPVEPMLQFGAPFPRGQVLNAQSDLSKGDYTGEERFGIGGFQPTYYA